MYRDKETMIDDLLGRMSPEQMAGQLVVFGMNGTVLTPDMVELIARYHVGGVRISQKARLVTLNTLHSYSKPGDQHTDMTMRSVHPARGPSKDLSFPGHPPVLTTGEYAAMLNRLRKLSLERESGIPVHFVIDQEGNGTDDLLGGTRLFPHPMGLAGTGDTALAYRVGLAIGTQVHAVGIDMVQMVLDVNTTPENPEVGPRSFGDNADDVCRWARELFRGLHEGGVMVTGKHFAGRGESTTDAHWGLPTMDVDRTTLLDVHLRPFVEMMEAGLLPGIMAAHCIYPALGETTYPATLSRKVLTDFLRGEMGYQGVVITDNMMMGGVIKQYEMSDAIVRALKAGVDLALCRDESPVRRHILATITDAITSGELPHTEVEDKLRRILSMRWDMGLFGERGGIADTAEADRIPHDREIVATATEAADKSIVLMRDDAETLPLNREQRVLVVEQTFVTQVACNNAYSHPGLLWEELSRHSPAVGSIEISDLPADGDMARLRKRLAEDEFDVIVTTNYFHYKIAAGICEVVDELLATGKPVVVVANNPFAFSVKAHYPTVVVCYNPAGRENMGAVADILYGAKKAVGKLPVKL